MLRKRLLKRIGLYGLLTLFLGVCILSLQWVSWMNDVQCDLVRPVRVQIRAGLPLRSILEQLKRAGIVKRPLILEWVFRIHGRDRAVKAGLYEFKGRYDTLDLYEQLIHGQILTRELHFVEGWNRFQVAHYLAHNGIAADTDVLEAMKSKRYVTILRKIDPEITDLEGFLYPSTYRFAEPVTLDKVFHRLLDEFLKNWHGRRVQAARHSGLTPLEVVTLASLVEKETARGDERAIVASVYLNRLARHMRLACDPTVIYAWLLEGRNPVPLSRDDLRIDSPYNTYLHTGLPPGPIANPGSASIDAVLNPVTTRYYYFVADGMGGHRFARTYREHMANIRKYKQGLPP